MSRSSNRRRFLTQLTVLLLLGGMSACCDALGAAEKPSTNRWEKEIQAFEAQDRKQAPPEDAALFVGSSSIRIWKLDESFPGVATINRGFGGSQLADSVHFAPRIVIPYRPKLIVLYAGDNDIAAGKSPEQVFGDFKQFVQVVRKSLPETRIAYLSIKPSILRWSLVDRMQATNRLIKQYVDEQDDKLSYVDVFTPMLGADGMPRKELFRADGLHLSAEGYTLWASVLQPAMATVATNASPQ
ncbi:MAG TPA: SGNH/GDSL hydrolase family protein [Pirellulales bacterium]|nr:SGNH/GDSL hydrolase family protein [Pirellulales bacterium]